MDVAFPTLNFRFRGSPGGRHLIREQEHIRRTASCSKFPYYSDKQSIDFDLTSLPRRNDKLKLRQYLSI